MSGCQPAWLLEVLQSYDSDPVTQELLAKLLDTSVSPPNYTLQDGLIRYKGRIWVGKDDVVRSKLVQAMHASAVGGHSGLPATYWCIKQNFYWPGLKAEVCAFVTKCTICQQAKPDRNKLLGLLQSLLVPERS